jgi:hypothetical protein
MLDYVINAAAGWMAMWNFTKCMDANGLIQYQSAEEHAQFGVYAGMFRPMDIPCQWKKGIQWNVTIPPTTLLSGFGSSLTVNAPHGIGVCKSAVGNNLQILFGYSLDDKNPHYLWGPVNLTSTVQGALAVGSDCAVLANPTDMKYYAYDLYTGRLKWASDPNTYPWGSVTSLGPFVAYNKLICTSYDKVHAFDMATGKEAWSFFTGNSGVETPYGTWIPNALGSANAGGGFIYFTTGAWHPNNVYARGDRMFCMDQATGKMIWNMSGFWFTNGPLANGYLVGLNEYDECIYAWSKGPSATTVSVQQDVIANGTSAFIKGTVTDQSPGAKDTPAISDQWMTPWMEYIYEQQPKPTSATGVPVYLQAYRVDDKSMIDVGSTYSDINGHYEFLWTPPTTGTYKILVSFPGSDAYWQSSAETALGVTAAPAAPASTTVAATTPDYTPMLAGIIVAVVVVAILVVYSIFRKK